MEAGDGSRATPLAGCCVLVAERAWSRWATLRRRRAPARSARVAARRSVPAAAVRARIHRRPPSPTRPRAGSLSLFWRRPGAALAGARLRRRRAGRRGRACSPSAGSCRSSAAGCATRSTAGGACSRRSAGSTWSPRPATPTPTSARCSPAPTRRSLFSAVDEVARRLAVKPPGQIRLTYLPCCGVVAWGRSRALILGLPLLRVLTLAELARSSPTSWRTWPAATPPRGPVGPVRRGACGRRWISRRAASTACSGTWRRLLPLVGPRLIGPIARGQEARADRSAAAIAGGTPRPRRS